MCFRLLKYNWDFKIEFALPWGKRVRSYPQGVQWTRSRSRNRTAGTPTASPLAADAPGQMNQDWATRFKRVARLWKHRAPPHTSQTTNVLVFWLILLGRSKMKHRTIRDASHADQHTKPRLGVVCFLALFFFFLLINHNILFSVFSCPELGVKILCSKLESRKGTHFI